MCRGITEGYICRGITEGYVRDHRGVCVEGYVQRDHRGVCVEGITEGYV